MFLLPVGCLIFVLLILSLPFLLLLLFLKVITFGFENLGFSGEFTLLVLFLILVGSVINIPLTKRKKFYTEKSMLFGFIKKRTIEYSGITINLGGAIIPIILSVYFLTKIPPNPTLMATGGMIVICFALSRVIPGKGIALPALIPPIFSALLAIIFNPQFAASTAFVSGVLGTLIGADVLRLRKAMRLSPGLLSIGGAGVFDGIFLVGIVSTFLTSL